MNPNGPMSDHQNNINKQDDISNYYRLHDKKLGEGGFASVRLATQLATGQHVAIKCLDKVKLGPEMPRIYNEIEVLKRLKHQNIARMYQVFETPTFIYLVLEYCSGGELFDYIIKNNRLEEPESARILYDLMKVLDFIHINGFAHRDLKPENVLLDERHRIKLIDFGLATTSEHQGTLDQLKTCCGSVTYAAPEVISGQVYSGPEVDVWSAGVMLYALLVGQLPFNDDCLPKLYQKIQGGVKVIPDFLSLEAGDLIRKMLTVNPKQRITVREILLHPWLRNRANTFARINRRLDFSAGQLDEQIILRVCDKFPHVEPNKLRQSIREDFNYYSTTYHLLQSKCPPRTFGVKRTPDRCEVTPKMAGVNASTSKKIRFATVSNTPQTPKTMLTYLKKLHDNQSANMDVVTNLNGLNNNKSDVENQMTSPSVKGVGVGYGKEAPGTPRALKTLNTVYSTQTPIRTPKRAPHPSVAKTPKTPISAWKHRLRRLVHFKSGVNTK